MFKKTIFIFLFFLIFNSAVQTKELKITSDRLEVDRDKKISTFIGNVYLYEKDMEIWADKIIVKFSDNEEKVNELHAENNVKIVRESIVAFSDSGTYYPLEEILELYNNVEVTENGNLLRCDELILDIVNSRSIMRSNSSDRVEALIINN
tara:strand:+ start:3232 stop:3681 length:450 start_codon:yes stop_codon:yes gene_type:complete